MKFYAVKAEMVDSHTGERLFEGDVFKSADADQVERLTRAGCLGDEVEDPEVQDPAGKSDKGGSADDSLDKLTAAELKALALDEGAAIAFPFGREAMIAAIRAKRAGA